MFKAKPVDIGAARSRIILRYQEFVSSLEFDLVDNKTWGQGAYLRKKISESTKTVCITDASRKDGVAGISVGLLDRDSGRWSWKARRISASSLEEGELQAINNNIVISSPSILEVLDDLWLVENQIIVNPSTYDDEQGISPLLRIENINGVSKHGYSHQNHHDSLILQASSENGNVFDVAHDQQGNNNSINICPNNNVEYYSNMFVDQQENSSIVNTNNLSTGKDLIISSKVLKGRKSSKCNKKNLKSSTIIEDKRQTLIQSEVEEEEEKDTLIKKQEHNAKERIRRMKISETYMALGSLLPRLSHKDKRWTAPRIIDKALEYIPELENEIEELITLKKKTLSAVENIPVVEVVNQKNISSATLASPVNNSLTVSVNEVKKDEVIIQICRPRNKQKDFPSLLEYIEDQEQGIFIILSASTLHIMNESSTSSSNNGNDDSSAMLKEKVISWLTAN
ncbi:hypothetical protein G4B88_020114 [Cannabis sativa]|uniref:BHLH domain-containing protein n=1 Tax=Cannabis sativa TaxID=3483 RepID=A0A7J6E5E2_CANSA|nr:hypothetical protein G4B88_020114 [Cannabis sativa]